MKCPNCGEEVEQGNLYCPNCLEEVPWVKEFNTLETLQKKQDYTREKRIQKMKRHLEKNHLPKRRRKTFWGVFVVALILALAVGIYSYIQYRNYNSYAYQYHRAETTFNDGNYSQALEHVDRAITLEGNHEEAHCLLAEILYSNGDLDGAIKVIEAALRHFPNSALIYQELIHLYEVQGTPENIKELLDNCKNVEVRDALAEYITPDPKVNPDTGSYDREIDVEISGECDSYYYTTNGDKPDQSSKEYSKSIHIGEGTTELNVVGYSAMGIPSDVIYRKYIVELKVPDPPVILPEETSFDMATNITITVPDGCTCYYSFDQVPTTESTQYSGPINMPEGTHTLYAFLVGASGKQSETASKTYELFY